MITLTEEYTKRKQAAAVPGAYFEGGRWLLPLPTPRSSVVALKLFPHLAVEYPELVELRALLFRAARRGRDEPAGLVAEQAEGHAHQQR
jgi:hypothetical protein